MPIPPPAVSSPCTSLTRAETGLQLRMSIQHRALVTPKDTTGLTQAGAWEFIELVLRYFPLHPVRKLP